MNPDINKLLGWEIISEDSNYTRISSPFTLADDGEMLAFSIDYPTPETFVLRDDHQAAMHAAGFGIVLDKSKLDKLNKTVGVHAARFDESGEIYATGHINTLSDSILDAIKLAMALSFNYNRWLPKYNMMRFRTMVGRALKKSIPDSSITVDYPVQGASGHIIRFPFAVKTQGGEKVLIDTIAAEDGNISWDNVYKTHGKMSDVKRIDDEDKRLIIMESTNSPDNFTRAASFLADIATIRKLENSDNWAEILKAA